MDLASNSSDSKPGSLRGSLVILVWSISPQWSFGFPLLATANQLPARILPKGGVGKSVGKEVGEELWEETAGRLRQICPGLGSRQRGAFLGNFQRQSPGPCSGALASWELGGWQRHCCFICSLLITCSVPGRNCCVYLILQWNLPLYSRLGTWVHPVI